MKPRTLNDVLTEYAKADKLSKQDPDQFPPAGRAGIQTRVRQSKDALPKLRIEYLTMILKNSAGFFLEGDADKVRSFSEFARANGAFEVDAAALFESLADKVQRSIGGRKEFSVTQVGLLDQALRELVEATGYTEKLQSIAIRDLRVVPNRDKLVGYIRELVVASNGGTPSRVAAQASIIDQAFRAKFAEKRLIVVVRNATSVDRAALAGLFSKVVTVDLSAEDEVNEKFVKETVVGALGGRKPASNTKPQTQSNVSAEPQAQQNQTKNQPQENQ